MTLWCHFLVLPWRRTSWWLHAPIVLQRGASTGEGKGMPSCCKEHHFLQENCMWCKPITSRFSLERMRLWRLCDLLADLQTAACGCIGVFVLALMTGLKDWTMSHNTTPVPFLVNLLFYELSKQHEMQSWEINRCYKAMFQNIQQSLKR